MQTNYAHPMLEPLNYDVDPQEASKYLDGDDLKIYSLLWRASFATNIEGPVSRNHQFEMVINDNVSLSLKWGELIEPGWTSFISFDLAPDTNKNIAYLSSDYLPEMLPRHNKQLLCSHTKINNINFNFSNNIDIKVQVKEFPKNELTYPSIIDEMVSSKVARPSTYASSINSALKNNLLSKNGSNLYVSSYGANIYEKIIALPSSEQLNSNCSYEIETAIEQIEQNPKKAGSLLNKFCRQIFNSESGLGKWLDDVDIDDHIFSSINDDDDYNTKDKNLSSTQSKLADSEPCELDEIIKDSQNNSKVSWDEHAWDDYTFTSNILNKCFSGRLKTRKANRLDISKEHVFKDHLNDFFSIVHFGLCRAIPMIEFLESVSFNVITDRTNGFGYLEELKLVYDNTCYELDFDEIKSELIIGLNEVQFYHMKIIVDTETCLEIEFK